MLLISEECREFLLGALGLLVQDDDEEEDEEDEEEEVAPASKPAKCSAKAKPAGAAAGEPPAADQPSPWTRTPCSETGAFYYVHTGAGQAKGSVTCGCGCVLGWTASGEVSHLQWHVLECGPPSEAAIRTRWHTSRRTRVYTTSTGSSRSIARRDDPNDGMHAYDRFMAQLARAAGDIPRVQARVGIYAPRGIGRVQGPGDHGVQRTRPCVLLYGEISI